MAHRKKLTPFMGENTCLLSSARQILSRIMLFSVLALLPVARAEVKVLFIGNSFTIGSGDGSDRASAAGGVPGIFDRLAQAGGQENPTTVMRAAGGQDFQYHSHDATTQAAIASQPWTYVVLQNYSTEPTHLVDGSHSLADHFTYGARLYDQIMSNSPNARVILYETWSRAAAHPLISGVSSPSSYASTDEMQSELRTNYYKLAEQLNTRHPGNPPVTVAPVGDAWQRAGGLLPSSDPRFVDLHASDNYHGCDNGYYLAAAVFYSHIYRASPRGLSTNALVASLNLNLTIDPVLLEEAAWATVSAALQAEAQTLLFDFGGTANPTGYGAAPDDPTYYWNNVTTDVGSSVTGILSNLVTIQNIPTAIGLVIIDPFNGANENGAIAGGPYPSDATRDSLYGNTELFNGRSNIFPRFKLTGLSSGLTYTFTFYASRTGVTDNRETGYTVAGTNTGFVALNAAGNVTHSVTVTGIRPDAAGEVTVSLAPTTNNNNGNHFTYLGVMRLDVIPPQQPIVFTHEPASQEVSEYASVTFNAAVQSTPPYFVQWLSNGVPIAGANQLTYTIASVTLGMDGARYAVTVSNLVYSATSSNAVLQVVRDTVPPAVLAFLCQDGLLIELVFSETLQAAAATQVSNYSVNQGSVQVLSAELRPDGKTVALTLARRLTGPVTVAIQGVRDLSNNEVVPGTTATGSVPDIEIQPLLFDFGAAGSPTGHGPAPDDPLHYWNNVTTDIGGSSTGQLTNLVTALNSPTTIGLAMLSRFNGANENGTTSAPLYPLDATRDSLFGNTETFSSLANIFPRFKLTGLNPAFTYTFSFYASRTGVTDNRETGYTVTGANTNVAALNAANNLTNTATIAGMIPTSAGEVTISLAPTAANNNSYHFTYLGVMAVEPVRPERRFASPVLHNGKITLTWTGQGQLEWAPAVLGPWSPIDPAPAASYSEDIIPGQTRFFRVR